MEFIRVKSEQQANECDELLKDLILSERTFDDNVKPEFQIQGFYKNYLNQDDYYIELIKDQGQAIGYIYGYIKEKSGSLYYHTTTMIGALFIREEYRFQGLATQLLEMFQKWSQDHHAIAIDINVYLQNSPAISLYEKFGFQNNVMRLRKQI